MKVTEFCHHICSGGTPLRSEPRYWENGTIPWLKTGEIKNEYISNTEESITNIGLKESSANLVPANSVVIAMYGDGETAGHAALTKIPLATNQACCNLIVDETKASPRFVYFLFKANYRSLISLKLGGSQQNLNAAIIKNIDFSIPPLPIQRKIAAVLSAYDDLIENNNRRIALLEKMGEELYREWFVRLRFPGHETTKIVNGVPEGWQMKRIEEISTMIKRGISPSYADDAKSIVLNQKCVRDNKINFGPSRAHESRVPKEKILQPLDVLINSTGVGTLGRIAVYASNRNDVTVDSHITIARANEKIVNPCFYGALLGTFQGYFEYIGTGATGQVELNKSVIESAQCYLPPRLLQDRFSAIYANQQQLIVNILKSQEAMTMSRDRLLGRLMSGKIDLEDLDIAFPPSMQEAA